MNDMTAVIVPKSDQINADDLIAGPRTIRIAEVAIKGGQEQPVSIYFDGSDKAFRPCKSMSRVLVAAWGPDAKVYVGRSLTLYRDPKVKWAGMEVGGIRISHMSHIERELVMALTETKGSRKPYVVKPLLAEVAPAVLDLDGAKASLKAAKTLEALRTAWSRKAMAPHRDALADYLEERKAALTFDQPATGERSAAAEPSNKSAEVVAADEREGRDDADMGERTDLATAKAEVDAAELVADVDARVAANLPLLGDDEADALREHAMAKIAKLKGER